MPFAIEIVRLINNKRNPRLIPHVSIEKKIMHSYSLKSLSHNHSVYLTSYLTCSSLLSEEHMDSWLTATKYCQLNIGNVNSANMNYMCTITIKNI